MMNEEILSDPAHFERTELEYHGLHGDKCSFKSREAAELFGKEVGDFMTLMTGPLEDLPPTDMIRSWLSEILAGLLEPYYGGVLCIFGIGNPDSPADSLGPMATKFIHAKGMEILSSKPRFKKVITFCPGVLWNTNLETPTVLASITALVHASCAIMIDATHTDSVDRLCNNIQISTAGLQSYYGLGNHNRDTIGVPVIGIGVPTLAPLPFDLEPGHSQRLYTIRSVEAAVATAAFTISAGIMDTIYPDLSPEEISAIINNL